MTTIVKNTILRILFISVIVLGSFELLYTFGYQGEPMTQIGFLSRTLGSLGFIAFGIIMLGKITKKWQTQKK